MLQGHGQFQGGFLDARPRKTATVTVTVPAAREVIVAVVQSWSVCDYRPTAFDAKPDETVAITFERDEIDWAAKPPRPEPEPSPLDLEAIEQAEHESAASKMAAVLEHPRVRAALAGAMRLLATAELTTDDKPALVDPTLLPPT